MDLAIVHEQIEIDVQNLHAAHSTPRVQPAVKSELLAAT